MKTFEAMTEEELNTFRKQFNADDMGKSEEQAEGVNEE